MRRSSRDRMRIIVYMLMVCLVLLLFVCLTATKAKIQYDINKISKDIKEAEARVRGLEVKIKTSSNITNIEERAIELGFIYPGFDQVRYLASDEEPMPDFALALIETAYR